MNDIDTKTKQWLRNDFKRLLMTAIITLSFTLGLWFGVQKYGVWDGQPSDVVVVEDESKTAPIEQPDKQAEPTKPSESENSDPEIVPAGE